MVYKKKKIHLVTTKTPHRISFAGGGSDIPYYYKKFGGSFINCTIDKFVYVTVKRHHEIFNENFRIMYSKTEHANKLFEIKNDITRTCLKILKIKEPILICTYSDLHEGSGLGSSSSFAVGLLNALYAFKGAKVSKKKLAKMACKIEIDILKKNCGIQDQYSVAIGGLNKFDVNKKGIVKFRKVNIKEKNLKKLFKYFILVWSKKKRKVDNILKSYDKKNLKNIKLLKDNVSYIEKILINKKINLIKIGKFLSDSWILKKKISNKISNNKLDFIYKKIIKIGAIGGKLSGAGGGGFFFFIMSKIINFNKIQKSSKTSIMKVGYYPYGSKVINKIYYE